jgi:branched-chain amino acid aminotransferase
VSIRVFLDGAIQDEAQARVSVFDRGFLYGDGVYEVVRTAGGVPVDLPRHLERLARSAEAIALVPPTPDALEAAVRQTLAAAANPESYVRVMLTRGEGRFGLDPALSDEVRLVVIVRPLTLPPDVHYRDGIGVRIVDVRRTPRQALDPRIKSGNYLNNILALAEARRHGADEGIMCNTAGRLVEGTTSNLFVVKGGVVSTPALDDGLLDGITRRRVLELGRGAGLTIREAALEPADLESADEAFLSSSIRGVLPVVRVDGAPLGQGVPGPVTGQVMRLYDEFLGGSRAMIGP